MEFFKEIEAYHVYIIAFFMAFVIAWLATPISKKIALKIGALDYPKARGMHTHTMPLAGGLAIYAGFTITVLSTFWFIDDAQVKQVMGLILGASVIMIVGLLDDIYSLSPGVRIIFQVFSALIVIMTGTIITDISLPIVEGGVIEFGYMSGVITVFWIVGMTNAINLIDGLDGLATGVASIASVILMIIAIFFADPAVAGISILLTAILSGSCLGFLPYNFNPAKIFMGDTGSTFLGFALAVISVQTMLKTYTALTMVVAVLVLGLPIFDTFFAICRRLLNRQPISQGDRGHLHHRLIDRGLSQKKAVLTLYVISGIFGIAAILVLMNDFFMAIVVVGFLLLLWFIDLGRTRGKKRNIGEGS